MYLLVTGLQSMILAAVAAGLIFGLAGRWDLWNVWVYVGILLALSLFRDLVRYRKSPDLLKERLKPASGEPRRQIVDYFIGRFGAVLAALERSPGSISAVPKSRRSRSLRSLSDLHLRRVDELN